MLTIDEFLPGFGALCEVYGRQPSKTLTDLYYDIVKDYFDGHTWPQAVRQVLASRVYTKLPLPAELINAAHGDPQEQSALAWADVLKAMRVASSWESVQFADPLIGYVIERRFQTWPDFVETDEELHFKERDFREYYEACNKPEREMEFPHHLPGRHEINNKAINKPYDPPMFIGEFRRAPRQIEAFAAALLKEV